MKFPKNRANVYVVTREANGHVAFLGVFSDLVEADNYKDSCAAEWFDKTKGMGLEKFNIHITTYYG